MIPIGDNLHRSRFPLVTLALVAVNAAVFAFQAGWPEHARAFAYQRFGVVPARMHAEWAAVARDPGLLADGIPDFLVVAVLPFLTCMFLHAGLLHLVGNMLFLWIFGDDVEDRLGGTRFLLFYLLCGAAASVVHVVGEPAAEIPAVGASGAVAGVLGAFFLLHPGARVRVLVPVFVVLVPLEIRAFYLLGLWLLFQVAALHGILGLGGLGSVAWWAHVGGFAAGVLLLPVFLLGAPRRRHAD